MISKFLRRIAKLWRVFQSTLRKIMIRWKYPNCKIGKRVHIGTNVEVSVTDGGQLVIGDDVAINSNCVIIAKKGSIEIKARTFVGWGAVICANESITIGEDGLIAEHVSIRDQNHGIELAETPFNQQPMKTAAIVIESDVWIGARCSVLPGVSIGRHSVIGSNSVVSRDINSFCVAVGAPAKTLRTLEKPQK